MLTLQVKEKQIENLTPKEEFIRGTVGAECQINLDEFWQGYENTVVFKRENDCTVYNVVIDSLSNRVEIPYTILSESGSFKVGLFGVKPDEVLPTLWSDYIKVRYGTDTHGTTPPKYEPNEIDQLRLSKQDKLTAGDNITIDENNVISASGGGTTDYALLENKPQINGVELLGNKSLTNLGIDIPTKTSELENDSGFIDDTAFENYYTKTEVDEKTVVDQTYSPTSENAQSGKAVAKAVEPKLDKPSMPPTVGNVLKVLSVNEDGTFTCEWSDTPSGGAVDDVKINGASIVENGVANIPFANSSSYGVVKPNPGYGLNIYGSTVKEMGINPILNKGINDRQNYRPITGAQLDYAVKVAMCDGKGEIWTDAERIAALLRMGCMVDDNGFVKWTAQEVAE